MSIITRLLLGAILLSGWLLLAVFNRYLAIDKILAMPRNTSDNISNLPASTIEQNSNFNDDPLQNQIQSELYNSISSGMTYAEVSSIIGWEGILIYENKVREGERTIHIKVYRWNYQEGHLGNIVSEDSMENETENRNLVLEFQNDILLEQNFSDRNLY